MPACSASADSSASERSSEAMRWAVATSEARDAAMSSSLGGAARAEAGTSSAASASSAPERRRCGV